MIKVKKESEREEPRKWENFKIYFAEGNFAVKSSRRCGQRLPESSTKANSARQQEVRSAREAFVPISIFYTFSGPANTLLLFPFVSFAIFTRIDIAWAAWAIVALTPSNSRTYSSVCRTSEKNRNDRKTLTKKRKNEKKNDRNFLHIFRLFRFSSVRSVSHLLIGHSYFWSKREQKKRQERYRVIVTGVLHFIFVQILQHAELNSTRPESERKKSRKLHRKAHTLVDADTHIHIFKDKKGEKLGILQQQ